MKKVIALIVAAALAVGGVFIYKQARSEESLSISVTSEAGEAVSSDSELAEAVTADPSDAADGSSSSDAEASSGGEDTEEALTAEPIEADTETEEGTETDAESASEDAVSESLQQLETLAGQVQSEVLDARISAGETWAVSWVNLSTGDAVNINGSQQMLSASVLKVFIMAAAYNEGRTDLASSMESMITVSDNDAANSIVSSLGDGDFSAGMNIVNAYCQNNGYTATHMGRKFLGSNANGDNYTSANDCAAILTAIYNGTCVSREASAEMLALLKAQTRLNKIPAGVSAYGVTTANKTGELSDASTGYAENDIAIVFTESGAYVLCVLSSGVNNSAAITAIQNISSLTYQGIV